MERISNHLNERNRLSEQLMPTEWLPPSSTETKPPSAQYLAWMVKIISKAISLANAPMLTEPELLVRARDWSEELHGIVPMEALNASVRRAFENHKSTFPLNAYDLKIAYLELKGEQLLTMEAKPISTDERVAQCPNRSNHLPDRFGEVEIYIHGVTDDDVIVPCGRCRVEDFTEARARLLAA